MRERYFEPAVEREVRRERVVMQTEKQESIDELSSTLAHEIRNPIAAAKSLVQQMGEDPTSVENVEYAKVAIDELDRVEKRISHLLRFAKEEDYRFEHVNLAAVVDAALTQLRAKLDAAQVRVVAQLHRRADDQRRQGEAQAGLRQHARQRHRRARRRGRGPSRRPLHRERRQARDRPPARQRRRHPAREARADLQPVLHHQGQRHRPRHGDLEEDRRGTRGHASTSSASPVAGRNSP